MTKAKILWWLYMIPALAVELIAWWLAPIVCMFVTRTLKAGKDKRLNKEYVVVPRDNLVWWLSLFNTHDNYSDEGWRGMYKVTSLIPFLTKYLAKVTQEKYDNSRVLRWYYRVWWLQRNCAYGWHYWLFSMPYEDGIVTENGIDNKALGYEKITIRKSSYQIQAMRPFTVGPKPSSRFYWMFEKINKWLSGYKNDVNIGWKAHKGKPKLLYANRFFAPRKI